MTYTINGKEYLEFDINKRCAEILYPKHNVQMSGFGDSLNYSKNRRGVYIELPDGSGSVTDLFTPCMNPSDTWPIIEKCWDRLMTIVDDSGRISYDKFYTRWEFLMDKHNCTKLVAPCICFIEVSNDNN